ncbi:MAG: FecR family protein [Nitrospirae bacterium YQR-1]
MNIKKIILLLLVVVVSVVIYGLVTAYLRHNNLKNKYIINNMEGFVKVRKQGQPERRAVVHDELEPGDVIKCMYNSKADVLLKKGTAVRVKGNSAIKVEEVTPEGNPVIKLSKGSVLSKVTRSLSAAKAVKTKVFTVKTPNAVAGVRGTSFLVKYNDDNEIPDLSREIISTTEVAVLDGTVSFYVNSSSVEVDISGGKRVVLEHFSSTPKISSVTADDKKRLEEIGEIKTELNFFDSFLPDIKKSFNLIVCRKVADLTKTEMGNIETALISYSYGHEQKMPERLSDIDMQGKKELYDSCGLPYLYKKINSYTAEIRSAGSDMEFFTDDDIVKTVTFR